MLRICKVCGKEYETCPECDKRRNLSWRHDCCSVEHWQQYMTSFFEEEEKDMDKEKVRILYTVGKINGQEKTEWSDGEYDVKDKVFRFKGKDGDKEVAYKDKSIKAVVINDVAAFARLVDGPQAKLKGAASTAGAGKGKEDAPKDESGQEI